MNTDDTLQLTNGMKNAHGSGANGFVVQLRSSWDYADCECSGWNNFLGLLQHEIIRMQGEMRTTRHELDVAQQSLAAEPPAQAFSPLVDTRMMTKPRFVLWSRGKLVHTCNGDTSFLWSVGIPVCVQRWTQPRLRREQCSMQACNRTDKTDRDHFSISLSC